MTTRAPHAVFARHTHAMLAVAAPLSAALLAGGAHATTPSHYGVTISTGATKNMSFSGGVYSATADNAVLNVNDLTNALNSGNVEVTTGNGAGGDEKGDLHVEAGFTWASSYALTLDAYHTIFVDQPVVDSGAGALTLTNNDGGTAGTIVYGTGGSIAIWGLTNSLTIDGQAFTLVGDVHTLAGDIAANPAGAYAMANAYDASKDGTYSSAPVPTTFTGVFDGLGNAVQNLTIVQPSRKARSKVGLFEQASGSIRNIGLTGVHIENSGYASASSAGALAAYASGTISQSWSTGSVSSPGAAGGLVGQNYATITASWSAANVESPDSAGGLVGGGRGAIEGSYATGNVTVRKRNGIAGGLAGGAADTTVSNSHATGNVRGGFYTGGLIGNAYQATILNCYATGAVQGGPGIGDDPSAAGGLVGVVGSDTAGVGILEQSFATGTVSGIAAGGLVGDNSYTEIINSYAEGKVDAKQVSGGLIGTNDDYPPYYSTVGTSYSTGLVEGGRNGATGGFMAINANPAGYTTNSYWDKTTSQKNKGVGVGNASGVTGETTAQLQAALPSGFDPTIWAQSPSINNGFPYLIANPPPQ